FVAGLGGALVALYEGGAHPEATFPTLVGLVWLAVVVTVGVRMTSSALVAGLNSTILPGLFVVYFPVSLLSLPPALFGVGAILVAKNPDGVLQMHGRQLKHAFARLSAKRKGGEVSSDVESPVLPAVPSASEEPLETLTLPEEVSARSRPRQRTLERPP